MAHVQVVSRSVTATPSAPASLYISLHTRSHSLAPQSFGSMLITCAVRHNKGSRPHVESIGHEVDMTRYFDMCDLFFLEQRRTAKTT